MNEGVKSLEYKSIEEMIEDMPFVIQDIEDFKAR
jgi:hypothetical protein